MKIKAKILFLDVYKKSNSRISKDTSGGYGTENDFGPGLIPLLLKSIVKYGLYWPNLMFVQLYTELKNVFEEVDYLQLVDGEKKIDLNDYDYVFICNSIVCFETELKYAKMFNNNQKIFLCGNIFPNTGQIASSNWCILIGNYDYLIAYLKNNQLTIENIHKLNVVDIPTITDHRLKMPDWGLEFSNKVKNLLFGYKRHIPYLSTRGCPYSCAEYCTYPLTQGKKLSQLNINNILEDLSQISLIGSGTHVVFRDPVFSIDKRHSKLLLNMIVEKKLNKKLSFTVELHLNNLDEELIDLMRNANVKVVKFGIESSIELVRDGIKRFSIENSEQQKWIRKFKKASIKTIAMYILCQPDDTYETMLETIDYSIKLNTDLAQYSIFTPYPGTPYYIKNKNLLINCKFEEFNQYNLVYKHQLFNKKEAKKILAFAYTKYYLSKLLTRIFIK